MNKLILFPLLFCLAISAQDTIVKNYPNTDQRWEIVSLNGKKKKETIYHLNGESWMSASYDAQNRERWNWYHDNGNPFFKATIINDKIEGPYRIWYEDGQLAEELKFIDNLENGPARFYYPNGQLAMSGSYENGRMVGEWTFYDSKGQPANGEWKWFFAALPDQVRMQGNLINGRRTGKWTYDTTAAGADKKTFTENFKMNKS